MSAAREGIDRLLDLLADQAGGEPLSSEESHDLERLMVAHPEVDPFTFEQAAAAIHMACLEPPLEPLPKHLESRLIQQASKYVGQPAQAPRPKPSVAPWLGWLTAAAAVLVLWLQTGRPASPSPVDIEGAPDAISLEWTSTDDPFGSGVRGAVNWSGSLQSGYMRFEGLPVNDPSIGQYQLWIFDADRPAEHPVDGGVFDATAGETLVPIDAKLAVADATLFAITYERPGGVVVSSRERLLLTAAVQ